MIAESHAVHDPRAMMVHLENATSTDTTMMTSVWFVFGAPLAMPLVTGTLRFLHVSGYPALINGNIVPFWVVIRNGAWVC